MKPHRIKEFEPRAWATRVGPGKAIFMQLGPWRFTATPDEAEAFAAQLCTAADEVRDDS